MEYRLKGVSEWTSVPNATSTIYDLVAGTYEVRFEEQANFNASAVVEVVINEYNHVCGSLTKTDNVEATHFTEGKEAYWTCSCGKHYEDENGTKPINNINTWGIVTTTNHELSENWTFDETHHWKDCTIEGCENKDSYEIHKGGAATCTEQAICEVCGQKYGDLTAHNYNNEWSSNETNHWKECTCGDKKNNEEHTYGEWTTVREATETETGSKERTCTVCSYKETETISVNTHVHSYSTDWKFDVISHYKDCACGEKVDIANHDYSDDTDDTCNTCGFKRTINNPTPTPTPDPIEKDGLSGGAIAAIVVSGVLVLSLGGFSVFWFVIKKKSFKDLIKIFKK